MSSNVWETFYRFVSSKEDLAVFTGKYMTFLQKDFYRLCNLGADEHIIKIH